MTGADAGAWSVAERRDREDGEHRLAPQTWHRTGDAVQATWTGMSGLICTWPDVSAIGSAEAIGGGERRGEAFEAADEVRRFSATSGREGTVRGTGDQSPTQHAVGTAGVQLAERERSDEAKTAGSCPGGDRVHHGRVDGDERGGR
jgi:hypothetical protein